MPPPITASPATPPTAIRIGELPESPDPEPDPAAGLAAALGRTVGSDADSSVVSAAEGDSVEPGSPESVALGDELSLGPAPGVRVETAVGLAVGLGEGLGVGATAGSTSVLKSKVPERLDQVGF